MSEGCFVRSRCDDKREYIFFANCRKDHITVDLSNFKLLSLDGTNANTGKIVLEPYACDIYVRKLENKD